MKICFLLKRCKHENYFKFGTDNNYMLMLVASIEKTNFILYYKAKPIQYLNVFHI